jgi:hypothetical protein
VEECKKYDVWRGGKIFNMFQLEQEKDAEKANVVIDMYM